MDLLHHGIPMPTRKAVVEDTVFDGRGREPRSSSSQTGASALGYDGGIKDKLLSLLAHPNIASKHWIIRQYDHEVQGGSVIKPLTGPLQIGPSDAAVIRPKLNSYRGIAIGCGLAPQIEDPYQMALAAIDEAIRNVVAVGADRIGSPSSTTFVGQVWTTTRRWARSCVPAKHAATRHSRMASHSFPAKTSLHNQFTNSETGEVIRIPNTLLISAIGVIEDVRKCITMDFKQAGNVVCVIMTPENDESLAAAPRLHLKSQLDRRWIHSKLP